MGIVKFGIPEEDAEWLRTQMRLTTLVEGGTYTGGTALILSKTFDEVYTIENSDILFKQANEKLKKSLNVKQLQGDTREYLPKIIKNNENILFWLDAHWSGGDTYGEKDECPLLEELEIIFSSSLKNFAILIDDARLFLAPPPLPHNLDYWPTIKEISEATPDGFDLIVNDDVIYIAPTAVDIPKYIQQRTTSSASKYTEETRPSIRSFVRSLSNMISDFPFKK